MAKERKFSEVTSNFATPWEPAGENDSIEGTYLGFDEVPTGRKNSDKPFFKSHRIQPDGSETVHGLAGAILDRKFVQIPKGTYVKVTFVGMMDTNNGVAKNFRVDCEAGTKLLDPHEENIPF